MSDDSFGARWSKRKAAVRQGAVVADAPLPAAKPPIAQAPVPAAPGALSGAPAVPETPAAPPPVTLQDVAALTHDCDFSRFVQPGVDEGVKRAAMKKLFTDPHFNIMDGLDTYIGDYNTPDPLPAHMLKLMTQGRFLGLFDEDDKPATPEVADAEAVVAAPTELPTDLPTDLTGAATALNPPSEDENTDLRLQPHDALASQRPEPGAGPAG